VTQLKASDADNDTLTYSLSGPDAALFTLSASGVLSFKNAPNFEVPADQGLNNRYDLVATVKDASGQAELSISIQVNDLDQAELALVYPLTGSNAMASEKLPLVVRFSEKEAGVKRASAVSVNGLALTVDPSDPNLWRGALDSSSAEQTQLVLKAQYAGGEASAQASVYNRTFIIPNAVVPVERPSAKVNYKYVLFDAARSSVGAYDSNDQTRTIITSPLLDTAVDQANIAFDQKNYRAFTLVNDKGARYLSGVQLDGLKVQAYFRLKNPKGLALDTKAERALVVEQWDDGSFGVSSTDIKSTQINPNPREISSYQVLWNNLPSAINRVQAIAYDAENDRLFIANGDEGGRVWAFKLADKTLETTSPALPFGLTRLLVAGSQVIALAGEGYNRKLYRAGSDLAFTEFKALDAATLGTVTDLRYDSRADRLVGIDRLKRQVFAMDPRSGAVTKVYDLGQGPDQGFSPGAIAWTDEGLAITDRLSGDIALFNPENPAKPTSRLGLGSAGKVALHYLAWDANNNKLWASQAADANGKVNNLFGLDLLSGAQDKISTTEGWSIKGLEYYGLTSPKLGFVLVRDGDSLAILDPRNNQLYPYGNAASANINPADYPAVAVDNSKSLVYALNLRSKTLEAMDVSIRPNDPAVKLSTKATGLTLVNPTDLKIDEQRQTAYYLDSGNLYSINLATGISSPVSEVSDPLQGVDLLGDRLALDTRNQQAWVVSLKGGSLVQVDLKTGHRALVAY
jgi:hypothetical protein